MTNRTPIVGGNWKMNTDAAGGTTLTASVIEALANTAGSEVVLCPPFTYLRTIADALKGNAAIELGAQNVYHETNGAFTGEISTDMLLDCGCKWVLTGHSERRHVIGEPDLLINQKTRAALAAGLKVILCIGETQAQREAGQTDAINVAQLKAGLLEVSTEQMTNIVIAYEPVWAIGTGLTATPEDAQNAHAAIRTTLTEMYGYEVAQSVRIQYGGSVKPGNANELFSQPDIDGGLIGGAALNADDFAAIVIAAAQSTSA